MGRCELNSRQTVVCRGRPVVGSLVFTGCQSAYCRWLLSHVATTIPGRRVFFKWYTREYRSFTLPFDVVVVFSAHASALEKGSLKGIMLMIYTAFCNLQSGQAAIFPWSRDHDCLPSAILYVYIIIPTYLSTYLLYSH